MKNCIYDLLGLKYLETKKCHLSFDSSWRKKFQEKHCKEAGGNCNICPYYVDTGDGVQHNSRELIKKVSKEIYDSREDTASAK